MGHCIKQPGGAAVFRFNSNTDKFNFEAMCYVEPNKGGNEKEESWLNVAPSIGSSNSKPLSATVLVFRRKKSQIFLRTRS